MTEPRGHRPAHYAGLRQQIGIAFCKGLLTVGIGAIIRVSPGYHIGRLRADWQERVDWAGRMIHHQEAAT